MLRAALLDRPEARADLDALHRIDAHHRAGQVRIQALEHGFAPARRNPFGDHRDARANGISRLADAPNEIFEFLHAARVRAEKRILVGGLAVDRLQHDGSQLRQISMDADALPLAQVLARDGARGHAHDGLARRGTPAAAIVAKAVFLLVRIVGMPGAKAVLDLLVVARTLIFVCNHERDRRTRGLAFEYARQDAHRIGLVALTGKFRGSGAAAIDIELQVRFRDLQSRRTTVHYATQRGAVALAKTGHGENPTESITRHASSLLPR